MMSDTITLAWPADGSPPLAKVIHVEGGRIVRKQPSRHVPIFRYVERPVYDLRSLYIEVRLAAAEEAIALRARPKNLLGNRRMYPRNDGIVPNMEVVPRRWVGFDWDDLPLELQPCPNPHWEWEPDPLLEPWVGAQIALRRLPPPFRDVSCVWQVSAGAGYSSGFRLRTWHWLDHPVTGAALEDWLAPAIDRKMVDTATLREVQPHYLAVKVLGGPDPCPRRFGYLRLARQKVPVPDIPGIVRRRREIEQTKRPREQLSRRRQNPQSYGQQLIDRCLDAIRNAPDGTKHPTYKTKASRARYICKEYGLDWEPIRQALIKTYEGTLTATEANRRRTSSTLGVVNWLEARG